MYVKKNQIEYGESICQQIPGAEIDEAVGNLLVESMTPFTLEIALQVQQELQSRMKEADRLRQKQVERARYEVELARRRYMQVDPENRLVADALETEWNEKLRALAETQETYEKQSQNDRLLLDETRREEIMALATDIPRLWHNPQTSQRERKRIVRLLLEDVTLVKDTQIHVHVRFKGGGIKTLILAIPSPSWKTWTTDPKVVKEIDQLLDHHTESEIATILNQRGYRSGKGRVFDTICVARIRQSYKIKKRVDRLKEKGMLTQEEMAKRLAVGTWKIREWRNLGVLKAYAYNDRNECLYEPPSTNSPIKTMKQNLPIKKHSPEVSSDCMKEVQYEV